MAQLKRKKLKTIFFGTPDFALPALKLTYEKSDLVLVVTQEDRPRGRGRKVTGTPVKECALALQVPVVQPKDVNDPEFLDYLSSFEADLYIVVAYGQILSQKLIDLPKGEIINLHASILPSYRGAAPIQRAIMNGDDLTGVSVMKITQGLDEGPVALIKKITIGEKTSGEMTEQLAHLGAEALSEYLENIGEMTFVSQDDENATYAEKITKSDQYLDPSNRTALELVHQIRGLSPDPGGKLNLWGEEYTIYEGEVVQGDNPPGTVHRTKKELVIGTKKGSLKILSLKKPGKKRMTTQALLAGLRD